MVNVAGGVSAQLVQSWQVRLPHLSQIEASRPITVMPSTLRCNGTVASQMLIGANEDLVMDAVIPWTRLLALIELHYPVAGQGVTC